MKLKNLTALISKKVNESEITKTEMARELDMPISTFCYRCETGSLDWNHISKLKRLGVNISLKEFSEAMTRDLNQKVIIKRDRV